MGRLTLMGPSPLEQDATCVSGQRCHVEDRFGHLLSAGDRVILLDTCAVTAKKFYLDSTPGQNGRGKPDMLECQVITIITIIPTITSIAIISPT